MDTTTEIFVTKLRRLQSQLKIARRAEYSYKDSIDALDILLSRVSHQIRRVADSPSFSALVRQAILRDANFLITRATSIAGIIVRSTSVRNAFELYLPFLDVCRALVGEKAKLILSSEWQYIPFTYPQNIQELPDFIFIGLPASESDNALIFPCAGHELGHSVWQKHKLQTQINAKVRGLIDKLFETSRPAFEAAYPELKNADIQQDLFVQFVKSEIFNSVLRQSEELFSDFLGLCIFGESYLYAFEYLLAPRLSGKRSLDYPDTGTRVQILETFAIEKFKINCKGYSSAFTPDDPLADSHSKFVTLFADQVVEQVLSTIFDFTITIISKAKVQIPTEEKTAAAEKAFLKGVPTDAEASLGDLINAAWRVFRAANSTASTQQGSPFLENLSDLVFKSVEIYEIKKHLFS